MVRLWLTNTANTRVFNLAVPGARMKLVGGDSGRVEHQELVDQVLLAPSERAVVDVLVERPGELALEHPHPRPDLPAGHADRAPRSRAEPPAAGAFQVLRPAPELAAERRQLERWLAAPPDKVLALVAQMDDPAAMPAGRGRSPMPARCIPRSPATSPAAAPSAA